MAESLILVQERLNLQDFCSSFECFPVLPSSQGCSQAPGGIGEITVWAGNGEVVRGPWSSWAHAGTSAAVWPMSVPSLTYLAALCGMLSSPNGLTSPGLLAVRAILNHAAQHSAAYRAAESPFPPTPEDEAKFSLFPGPSSPPRHRLPFSETHVRA